MMFMLHEEKNKKNINCLISYWRDTPGNDATNATQGVRNRDEEWMSALVMRSRTPWFGYVTWLSWLSCYQGDTPTTRTRKGIAIFRVEKEENKTLIALVLISLTHQRVILPRQNSGARWLRLVDIWRSYAVAAAPSTRASLSNFGVPHCYLYLTVLLHDVAPWSPLNNKQFNSMRSKKSLIIYHLAKTYKLI